MRAYDDDNDALGVALISTGGEIQPRPVDRGLLRVSVWADDPSGTFENPTLKATSDALWAGRSLALQSSPNGRSGWATVPGHGAITEDTTIQGLSGGIFYRLIEGGDESGGNVSGIRAAVARM
ncbi:MAG: hypothetical protein AAF802_01765 [Planctomycetota bacterium]